MNSFDVIVIGCGPAGERAAIQAARSGRDVAVVERHHVVGGAAVNWGTIPSKTLRESALLVHSLTRRRQEGFHFELKDDITIRGLLHRERLVVQRELELINKSLDRYRVQVFPACGRFVDPHTVELVGVDHQSRMRIRGDKIIIATGTRPNRPPDVPFDGERVFDSDAILHLPRLPRSLVVLGAGVIGVEYASIFAALGLQVTLVNTRDELLPYLDREISSILARELRRIGVVLLHGDRHKQISVHERSPRVCIETEAGNLLEADALLYSVGRDGSTHDLGLETVGIQPTPRGLIEVNEYFQTAIPHIYAVGDVVGYPALANTSMDQGRQAVWHALNITGPVGKTEVLAFAIYSIPEVSNVGETEQDLVARGADYVVGRGDYGKNARGQIQGDHGGLLKLLFERPSGVLLGAHIVGRGASELIHIGQAFLRMRCTAEQLAETLFNYPTLSDMYRHAGLVALGELRKGSSGERSVSPTSE